MLGRVEEDLVQHILLLFGPPLGEIHRGDSVWFLTGDPDPYRNGIVVSDARTHDDVVRLLEPFRRRRQPMMWWFFTEGEPLARETHEALLAEGAFPDTDRPAMIASLDRVEMRTVEGVTVERVESEKQFRAYLRVVADAFSTPDRSTSLSTRSFLRWGFSEDAPFHHYLARLHDVPAATATLTFVDNDVGLTNIATVKSLQRRGIAHATVAAALDHAAARGATVATLSADPAGTRLYTKLGFETVGRHLTYVWKP